jgi:hypothetical protein
LLGSRFLALSRTLSLPQAWRNRTALAAEGLSMTSPGAYRAQACLDLLYVPEGVRDRMSVLAEPIVRRLADLVAGDGAPGPADVGQRGLLGILDAARKAPTSGPSNHSSTIALRELDRSLRAAGTTLIYFLPPANPPPERDAPMEPRLVLTLAAAGIDPGDVLDLRTLLDRPFFRDRSGHMNPAGCERTAAALAEAIGPDLARAPD